MAKWEQRPVLVGDTYIQPVPREHGGHANHPFEMYPKMLYKASSEFGGAQISGTQIVHDEVQERVALGQGWSDGQEAAIAAVAARETEMAKLAANRAYNEKWMSAAAKAEANEIDEQTMEHLPEIPEARKRGRPKKDAA